MYQDAISFSWVELWCYNEWTQRLDAVTRSGTFYSFRVSFLLDQQNETQIRSYLPRCHPPGGATLRKTRPANSRFCCSLCCFLVSWFSFLCSSFSSRFS